MTIQSFVNETDTIIDEALEKALKKSSTLQRIVTDEVLALLSEMDTAGGSLQKTVFNQKTFAELKNRIQKGINKAGFNENINNYFRSFNDIQKLQSTFQTDFNKVDFSKVQLSKVNEWARKTVIDRMKGAGLDKNFIKPVRTALNKSITAGASIKETRDILVRETKVLPRYISQVARDSISQYNGLINETVLQTFDFDGLAYVGGLVEASRPQCRRWVKIGEIAVKDLQKEINWAETNGQGMIPGTTPKTFFALRGGTNCKHSAVPIRL